MAQKLLCVVLVLAVAISIAKGAHIYRSDNVQNATVNEFPYVASIRVSNKHFCTGAIISNLHILTAANCILFLRAIPHFLATVVTGTDSLTDENPGNIHQVARAIAHPDYGMDANGWKRQYDIGVVKLATPITFNEMQSPVNLPLNAAPLDVFAAVLGWLSPTPPSVQKFNTLLQKYTVKTASEASCRSHLEEKGSDHILCGLSDNDINTRAKLNGGSPLVFDDTIIGVASGGIPSDPDKPDIFVDVYKHHRFVIDALNPNLDSPTVPNRDEILLHKSTSY